MSDKARIQFTRNELDMLVELITSTKSSQYQRILMKIVRAQLTTSMITTNPYAFPTTTPITSNDTIDIEAEAKKMEWNSYYRKLNSIALINKIIDIDEYYTRAQYYMKIFPKVKLSKEEIAPIAKENIHAHEMEYYSKDTFYEDIQKVLNKSNNNASEGTKESMKLL